MDRRHSYCHSDNGKKVLNQLIAIPARCHGEKGPDWSSSPTQPRQSLCRIYHVQSCWRSDGHRVIPRDTQTGFKIIGYAFSWPVLIWPALALKATPETKAERDAAIKSMEKEIEGMRNKLDEIDEVWSNRHGR